MYYLIISFFLKIIYYIKKKKKKIAENGKRYWAPFFLEIKNIYWRLRWDNINNIYIIENNIDLKKKYIYIWSRDLRW